MRWKGWQTAIAALASGLLGVSLTSVPAIAAPAMWRVSDADSSIWLFGSIHVLERGVGWRTRQFDDLLASADQVYFEVPFTTEMYATATQLTLAKGYLAGDATLDDVLSPEVLGDLKALLADYQVPYPAVRRMRPWLVELSLAQYAMNGVDDTGPDMVAGVEMVLSAEVPAHRARGLETAEFQISLLADRPETEQINSLVTTIGALNETGLDLSGLLDAWARGDVDGIHAFLAGSLGPDDGPFYEKLITARNRNWAVQADTMLRDNQHALLIVGAGHLVGEVGLPTLLEQRGYKVERIDRPE